MSTRALVAVRLSRVTDETTSPDRQRTAGYEEAARRGLQVVDVAEDLNVSASRVAPFERPELGPWLNERVHEFDVVIWHRLDRAVRSMGDLHDLAKWARKHKKRLIFASGPGGGAMEMDLTSAIGELIVMILAFAAQMESQANSERVSNAHAFLRSKGRWGGGTLPYGFHPVLINEEVPGDGWRLVHDPQTYPIVREMVERAISGEALLAIAMDLQERNIPTPRDYQDSLKRGKVKDKTDREPRKWSYSSVKVVLTSRALLGETQHEGQVVRDVDGSPVQRAEPIVTELEWRKLQSAIAARGIARTRIQAPSLLSAFLRCGNCGGPLYRQEFEKKGHTYVYLRCSGYLVKHNKCNEKYRGEAVEQKIVEIFLAEVGDLEIFQKEYVAGNDNREQILTLKRNIQDLEEEKDAGLFLGDDGKARYFQRKRKMNERLLDLEKNATTSGGWRDVPTGMTYATHWASASVKEQRELLLQSEVVAYSGRSGALVNVEETVDTFRKTEEPGAYKVTHLSGTDLDVKDLHIFILWRGDLAARVKAQRLTH